MMMAAVAELPRYSRSMGRDGMRWGNNHARDDPGMGQVVSCKMGEWGDENYHERAVLTEYLGGK